MIRPIAASRPCLLAAPADPMPSPESAPAVSAIRPPCVVARAIDRGAVPPAAAPLRAWLDELGHLPPAMLLLVLAQARWFLPARRSQRGRRVAIARQLVAELVRRPLAGTLAIDAVLLRFLLASPLITAADAPLLARGLAAFVAGDPLTSLHLLVPRLEAGLRALVDRLDPAPSVRAPLGLASLVRLAARHAASDDGFIDQVRAVLLGGGHDGLRHRLAHGRLPAAACTQRAAQDVLFCLLRLSRWTPTAAGDHAQPRSVTS